MYVTVLPLLEKKDTAPCSLIKTLTDVLGGQI